MRYLLCLIFPMFLVFASCSPNKPVEDDYVISVRLQADTPPSLSAVSRIQFFLWGYSASFADAAATPLDTLEFPFTSMAQPFEIRFTYNDFSRVTPKPGEKNEFAYYLSLKTDINGDTLFTTGDYAWDFDKTAISFWSETDARRHDVPIFIRALTANDSIHEVF
jgi:hypothetical protein